MQSRWKEWPQDKTPISPIKMLSKHMRQYAIFSASIAEKIRKSRTYQIRDFSRDANWNGEYSL